MKRAWYMRRNPGMVLVAGLGGLFTIVNPACTQPWAATGAPATSNWRALAVSADGTRLVAAGGGHYYTFNDIPDPIFVSTNAGASWTQTSAPSNFWSEVACSADAANLVAISSRGLIFTSSDMGQTWGPTSAPTNNWTSVASSADGTKLVAVTTPVRASDPANSADDGAIYRSADAGATWTRTSAPSNHWTSVASSADGLRLVASSAPYLHWDGTDWSYIGEGEIYCSADAGATWTRTSAPSNSWSAVASSADGVKLVAATRPWCPLSDGLIYISSDSGVTWTPTTAPSNDWSAVASSAD
ncbi:MAG: sialidase family protein, partial [Verrucomicrobia bacterium]|nr:sialidase family protein [Verrucomicrobiota bacterium]